jgi:hypothetical protein
MLRIRVLLFLCVSFFLNVWFLSQDYLKEVGY